MLTPLQHNKQSIATIYILLIIFVADFWGLHEVYENRYSFAYQIVSFSITQTQ